MSARLRRKIARQNDRAARRHRQYLHRREERRRLYSRVASGFILSIAAAALIAFAIGGPA